MINSQQSLDNKYASILGILNVYEEFILDHTGIIISANLESVCITGYEEWEIIGKHYSMFYRHNDYFRECHVEDLREVDEKGEYSIVRWMNKRKKVAFLAKLVFEKITSPANDKMWYRLKLMDNTHSELIAIQFQRIKSNYESLFNNTFAGIFCFRFSDGSVQSFNGKALEIVGLSKNPPTSMSQLFQSKYEYRSFKRKLMKQGEAIAFEFEIKCLWLTPRWGSITCKYNQDEDSVEGILQDITEKKKQLLQLKRLNEELKLFIYHSSHDLRAPLTSILGLAGLIKMEKPEEHIQKYADLISGRVNHIAGLLGNMVSIALNNSTELELSEFHVGRELSQMVKELGSSHKRVRINTVANTETLLFTDATRLRIIIRKLLENALHFHSTESSDPRATIAIEETTGKFIVTVSDNGMGMEEEIKKYIFNMFYRGTQLSNGAGLGLYIARCMVEKMNGRIEFESELGTGTTFKIELPSDHNLTHQGVSENEPFNFGISKTQGSKPFQCQIISAKDPAKPKID
jgi:signal transduction histidine kinase